MLKLGFKRKLFKSIYVSWQAYHACLGAWSAGILAYLFWKKNRMIRFFSKKKLKKHQIFNLQPIYTILFLCEKFLVYRLKPQKAPSSRLSACIMNLPGFWYRFQPKQNLNKHFLTHENLFLPMLT